MRGARAAWRAGLLATLVVAGCATARPPAVASLPVEPPGPSPLELSPGHAEPPASPGAVSLEGSLAPGAERPAAQTARFDADALPEATWGEGWPAAGFTLQKVNGGWSLFVRTTVYAEVIVTAGPANEKGTAPVGFTAFTGGSFGDGAVPACGRDYSGRRLAVWNGFAPAGWTDGGMDVEMEEGDFDLATCRGTPVRTLRGRAAAIVPGYVYAVRTRDEGDDGKVRESVVVFLPRGDLVATGGDPATSLAMANTGPFTRLTLPLEPGTASAASLRVSPAALAMWARLRHVGGAGAYADGSAVAEELLVGVDVAWQGGARLGTLSFALPTAKNRKAYAALLAAARKQAL
ncbi:MAG: hypothetical protein ABSE49_24130 [Polyangiaceae bacterium]